LLFYLVSIRILKHQSHSTRSEYLVGSSTFPDFMGSF